jgi:hypothetical protein
MSTWTLADAVQLCSVIEDFAPKYGAHVALTGGCLYRDGERKDVDILFYCIRQRDRIDEEGLLDALRAHGFTIGKHFGWVYKAKHFGRDVDLFFPEAYPAKEKKDGGDEDYNNAADGLFEIRD